MKTEQEISAEIEALKALCLRNSSLTLRILAQLDETKRGDATLRLRIQQLQWVLGHKELETDNGN